MQTYINMTDMSIENITNESKKETNDLSYDEFWEDDYEEDKMLGVGNYTFLRTIGHGQFGKVKLAIHNKTKTKVAIKIISKSEFNEGTSKFIFREIQIMKRLRHPNIIQLYEVIDTETKLFLVMEYASGGEIMDFIAVHGKLKERDASNFFGQVAWAVHYCHSRQTVHRDIKAENLLLDDHMNIKLIDFGLSNVFSPPQKLRTFCGSPMYAAPELVQHREYVGPEVDCWSLGVLLYYLVCGRLPFGGESYTELYQQILCANYTLPSYLSPECQDLIRHMLVSDPARRFTIEQIVRHPWVLKWCDAAQPAFSRYPKYEAIDTAVLNRLEGLGYERAVVTQSLLTRRFDDPFAVYYILSAETESRNNRIEDQEREPFRKDTTREKARITVIRPATLTTGSNNGQNVDELNSTQDDVEEKQYYSLKIKESKEEDKEKIAESESPTGAPVESPRQKRFAFNVEMTTEKDYKELMSSIKYALDMHDPSIKYVHLTSFMLECDCALEGLIFEVEICRLYRLSMNGIRFHKIKGKSTVYKKIMKSIVGMLKL